MTEDAEWLCWQTQVVPRCWVFTGGRGGEEGEGGSSAARRWIRLRRVAERNAAPGAGEVATPEDRRATVMLWRTLPSSPAVCVHQRQWRFDVFSWLILGAVCRSVWSQGDHSSQLLRRETLWNFSCSLVVFLTLFVTACELWADLLECLTQVLSGLNLKVQWVTWF